MSPRPMDVAVAVAVAETSARRGKRREKVESGQGRQDGQGSREGSLSFLMPMEAESPGGGEAGRVQAEPSPSRSHPPPPHRRVDHFPSSLKQRSKYPLHPSRRERGEKDAGETAGVGSGPGGGRGLPEYGRRGREYSARRRYKARLPAPELDERTCGVGRVSWSLG